MTCTQGQSGVPRGCEDPSNCCVGGDMSDFEMTVCRFVLCQGFTDEFTPNRRNQCLVGFAEGQSNDDVNCAGCSSGCFSCDDSNGDRMTREWSVDVNGHGYLRPDVSAINGKFRNEKNQIADFRVLRQGDFTSNRFTRNIQLLRPGCKTNFPREFGLLGDDACCWGEVGHPCYCHKGSELRGHGTTCPPVPGGGEVPCGSIIDGFSSDKIYFQYNDGGRTTWEMKSGNGSMSCRRFNQNGAFEGQRSEIHVSVTDDNLGSTIFHGWNGGACNINFLVPCAGKRVESAECSGGDDVPPTQPCFGPNSGGINPNTLFCQDGGADCGKFSYLRVEDWAPEFDDNGGRDKLSKLKNKILDFMRTADFPIPPDTGGVSGPFDSFQHESEPAPDDSLLGKYSRNWHVDNIEDGFPITTIEDIRLKYQPEDLIIDAELVFMEVDFKATVFLARVRRQRIDNPPFEYIEPHIAIQMKIKTGLRLEISGDIFIGGVDQPDGTNEGGIELGVVYDGDNTYPRITGVPFNDIIIDNSDTFPTIFDWRGKLSYQSDPVVEKIRINPDDIEDEFSCGVTRNLLGSFLVPGMPSDIDANDGNITKLYQGSITFNFLNNP